MFLELVNIHQDDFDCRRLTKSQLLEGFSKADIWHENQQARLLIPLDSYFWGGLTKLVISIERHQDLEQAAGNLKDISAAELSARRAELLGTGKP